MLIVCPNCASSYGVEMASLRPASGSARKVRCACCRWVWPVELSYAEKVMVAADAVLPVRRAMLAAAQAATDGARSTLPRLRRPTTILADELAATSAGADPAPVSGPSMRASKRASNGASNGPSMGPSVDTPARAAWRRVTGGLVTITTWRPLVGRFLAWLLNWRSSPSRLHWLVIGLAIADAAIISGRVNVVWVMPQTAPFYAALGLPVSLRGVQFDRLTAAAEQHGAEPVLIVRGQIGNSTDRSEAVPHLRFAILNAQQQEIYSWTAVPGQGRRLPAGETLGFESELVLPPPDTRAVMVRFVDPENAL